MTPVPVDLAQVNTDFCRRVYREILVPALRPSELESEEVFLHCIASGASIGLALAEPEAVPLSAIVGYPYDTERVLLIGYIATREELRSQGMGGDLLDLAVERWYVPDRFDVALAEIDDPRAHPGDEATKRLRFYDRHGAKLLSRPYFQPRLGPDEDRVPGMLLIALWSASSQMRDDGLRAEPVRSFLRTYFQESEGSAPRDGDYQQLIAAYDATPWIPTLPLSEFASVGQIIPEMGGSET